MSDLWLLTPCKRGRLGDLRGLLGSAGVPRDRVVVVTNPPDLILPGDVDAHVVAVDSDDFNISSWWNAGLDWISDHADGEHEVFMVESDVRITPDDLGMLAWTMRDMALPMVGADWHHVVKPGNVCVHREPCALNYQWRPSGIALLAAGELGHRRDEQFRWYYSDDDADFQARKAGGVGVVGGTTLQHAGGTPLVGRLKDWADEDAVKFRDKWGCLPL